MIDINFFMKVQALKQDLINGKKLDQKFVMEEYERNRSQEPVIYNIETTNACNMKCEMCPRTTMMTRPVETMDQETFEKVIAQIKPFSEKEWKNWESFVAEKYGIKPNDMSENHFFLYIIPKVIQLHGYGDPLLDKKMAQRVKALSDKGFYTYFSCNPANIDVEKNLEMFENGLNYIKYSIETVDDFLHKKIRGTASDFQGSYKKILQLLEEKKKRNLRTVIVITMLDLHRTNQQEEFEKLREAFKGLDVYIYLKSQDQMWYENKEKCTKSVHWLEFCQHPWISMTIKSNGEAVMCMEDFNNEIILGDVKKESLRDIWNGEKYRQFRQDHFNLQPGIKCTEQCDMKLIGSYFG
jgi:radical SAM protein with 4Fe4S-binding SPASM domain